MIVFLLQAFNVFAGASFLPVLMETDQYGQPNETHVLIIMTCVFLLLLVVGLAIVSVILKSHLDKRLSHLRDAKEEIQQSESRFRSLFLKAPNPLIEITQQGDVVRINHAVSRAVGYTLADVPTIEAWSQVAYPDPVYREKVRDAWDKSMDDALAGDGRIEHNEFQICCKDGTSKVFLIGANIIGDSVVISFVDIDDRKKMELELAASREQFSTLFDLTPFSCVINDFDGRYVMINQYFCNSMGLTREQIIGRTMDEIGQGMDTVESDKVFEEIKRTGSCPIQEVAYRYRSKRCHSLFASRVIDWQGEKAILSTTIDITEKKQLLERYHELFNHMGNGVGVCSTTDHGETFRIEEINESVKLSYGLFMEDVSGRDVRDIFPGLVDSGLIQSLKQVYTSGEPLILPEVFYQDGRIRLWCSLNMYKLPSGEIVIIGTNITDRKEARDALYKSETLYRTLVNTAPFGIRLTGMDGKIRFSNPAFFKIYHASCDDLIGRYIWDLTVDKEHKRQTKEYIERMITEQPPPEAYYSKHKTSDGNTIDVQINWNYLYDASGHLEGFISTVNDVTAIKKLEKQLQSVINSIGDPLYIADKDYRIIFQNAVSINQCGNLLGKTCYQNIFFQQSPCEFCRMMDGLADHCIKTVETGRINNHFYEMTFSPYIEEKNDPKSVIVYRDITEKKHFLAEALRTAHLASIGELAAAVAHEINNPVTGIICISEILTDKFEHLGGDKTIPERITKEAERISRIVKNLLSFARKQTEDRTPCDVNRVVEMSLDLSEKQMHKDGIHLSVALQKELPTIRANGQELQQVVLNLLSNAGYSLNEKYPHPDASKRLEISTKTIVNDMGAWIRLSVFDTGLGIPEAIVNKITDPFFSTKPRGKGTGLGLSICHGIIASHGGKLFFDSIEGDHATVIIELPVASSN